MSDAVEEQVAGSTDGNPVGSNDSGKGNARGRKKVKDSDTVYLQVRMTPEERKQVEELADTYGRTISAFVRDLMEFVYQTRPTIKIVPKADALAQ